MIFFPYTEVVLSTFEHEATTEAGLSWNCRMRDVHVFKTAPISLTKFGLFLTFELHMQVLQYIKTTKLMLENQP